MLPLKEIDTMNLIDSVRFVLFMKRALHAASLAVRGFVFFVNCLISQNLFHLQGNDIMEIVKYFETYY